MLDKYYLLLFLAGMVLHLYYVWITKGPREDMITLSIMNLFVIALIATMIWVSDENPILYVNILIASLIFFSVYSYLLVPQSDEMSVLMSLMLACFVLMSIGWYGWLIVAAIIIPLILLARLILLSRYLSYREKIAVYLSGLLALGITGIYQFVNFIQGSYGYSSAILSGWIMGYSAMNILPVTAILMKTGRDFSNYATRLLSNYSDRQMGLPMIVVCILYAMALVTCLALNIDANMVIYLSFILFLAVDIAKKQSN